MDKLLEIKIGGGSVRSGWLPFSAFGMVKDLIDAIAAEGHDGEIWEAIEPQLEVVGRGSTRLAVHTDFARKLRPQVRTFREKAKRLHLSREGMEFVKKHIATQSAPWTFVELIEVPDKKDKEPPPERARALRFDARYKERLVERQPESIHGFDEIYAVVVRAGGIKPPTATLEFLGGSGGGTYHLRGRDLAKRIAAHLYDTVRLRVEAWWNVQTLEIEKLIVHDLLEWKDIHLAEVYRANRNRLPIELSVDSVEELLADREKDRGE